MKRTFAEKLNIVSQVLSGVPQSRLCKEYHLGQHYLENLIDRYRKYGENGLNRKPHIKIPPERKIELARDFIENGVTFARYAMKTKSAEQPLNHGFAGQELMDMIHCDNITGGDVPRKTQWQDRKRKSHRQNWRSFRRKTSV